MDTENYATTSGFENLVTFEMQSADLRMWNAICGLFCQRSSSRPSSKAAGHLGNAEASEDLRSPDLGDARPVTRVDDSDGLGARDRGHSTARAGKHEEAWATSPFNGKRCRDWAPGTSWYSHILVSSYVGCCRVRLPKQRAPNCLAGQNWAASGRRRSRNGL